MPKSSLLNSRCTVSPIAGGIRSFHTFFDCISLKVNIIARLEFELAYYDVEVRHLSHYTPGFLRNISVMEKKNDKKDIKTPTKKELSRIHIFDYRNSMLKIFSLYNKNG